jgi:glycosyltransferase involved in cell wall biosynthesis
LTLDVVVPTYNRSSLLRKTIQSLLSASVPEGLHVSIIVVDNNSKDDTRDVVFEMQAQAHLRIEYVLQPLQGSSQTRNAGIGAGTGELIGVIDDDEEVEAHWYETVAREFADPNIQFIGGPCLPNCEIPLPQWLPPGYNGVIGAIEARPRQIFGESFPGILPGGNAVFRRAVFERVGLYDVQLGRSGKGLLSEEDAEFYRRLLAAGLRGFHVPDLAIYHYVPAKRLTRRYHRRWCFWRGVSQGIADKKRKEPVRYFFSIPRYRVMRGIDGFFDIPRNLSSRFVSGKSFARELFFWDLVGFVYGKHFVKIDSYYAGETQNPAGPSQA